MTEKEENHLIIITLKLPYEVTAKTEKEAIKKAVKLFEKEFPNNSYYEAECKYY